MSQCYCDAGEDIMFHGGGKETRFCEISFAEVVFQGIEMSVQLHFTVPCLFPIEPKHPSPTKNPHCSVSSIESDDHPAMSYSS